MRALGASPRNNNKPRWASSFKGRRRRARLPPPCRPTCPCPKMTSLMLPPCNIESIDRLGTCPLLPAQSGPNKSLENPTIPQTKGPSLNWCSSMSADDASQVESSTHPPPKGCTGPAALLPFSGHVFPIFAPLYSSALYPRFPLFFLGPQQTARAPNEHAAPPAEMKGKKRCSRDHYPDGNCWGRGAEYVTGGFVWSFTVRCLFEPLMHT